MARRYATAADFKQALDDQLRRRAQNVHRDLSRLRQRYVFERFLARLATHFGDRAVLKGGLALELRLGRARATQDIDLRVSGAPELLAVELSRAAAVFSLDGDFLQFTVEPDPRSPTIDAEGMAYQGQRFRAAAELAGKIFGSRFGVDVAFGDRMSYQPEIIVGSGDFAFAGIPPVEALAYAREVHIAEKLHALTMPRARPNSRVKDLPDLALLGLTGPFESAAVSRAIEATFAHRSTHPVPTEVPEPPSAWEVPCLRMVREEGLRWTSLAEVTAAVRAFLDPVLRGETGVWSPVRWSWEPPP